MGATCDHLTIACAMVLHIFLYIEMLCGAVVALPAYRCYSPAKNAPNTAGFTVVVVFRDGLMPVVNHYYDRSYRNELLFCSLKKIVLLPVLLAQHIGLSRICVGWF